MDTPEPPEMDPIKRELRMALFRHAEEAAASVRVLRKRLERIEGMLVGGEDSISIQSTFNRIESEADRLAFAIAALQSIHEVVLRTKALTPAEVREAMDEGTRFMLSGSGGDDA